MLTPKSYRKQKTFVKKCVYCGATFVGVKVSKFCPEHRRSHEVREWLESKAKKKPATYDNITLNVKRRFYNTITCALNGCDNRFKIYVNPHQSTYPKYCSDHRNEYRRKLHDSKNTD